MRIALIVVDDVLYQPGLYSRLVPRLPGQVVALGLVPVVPAGFGWWRYAARHVTLLGAARVAGMGIRAAVRRAARRLAPPPRDSVYRTMAELAAARGIPVVRSRGVNDPRFVEAMRAHAPDVILSSCTHIYREAMLRIPRIGILNVHAGRLPDYRGVYPVFWAMLNGDAEYVLTAHFINERIDGGPVVVEEPYPILPDATFLEMLEAIADRTPDLVLRALGRIGTGEAANEASRCRPGGRYYSFPARADVARFRALGRRIG